MSVKTIKAHNAELTGATDWLGELPPDPKDLAAAIHRQGGELLPVIQPKTAQEHYQDVMEMVNVPITVAQEVDTLVVQLLAAETVLERGYAKLGSLLNRVWAEKLWQDLGCESFGDYMKRLSEKHARGKTSLYSYLGVSQSLLPYMTEESLNTIGISKARELKKYVDTTGAPPTEEVMTRAADPKVTVKDVKKLLFDAREPELKGTWVCLQGYLNEDELQVYRAARECALRASEAVKTDTPDWKKDMICLALFSMEFLAANADRVEKEGS